MKSEDGQDQPEHLDPEATKSEASGTVAQADAAPTASDESGARPDTEESAPPPPTLAYDNHATKSTRKCPSCNRVYPESTQRFCLDDGAILEETGDALASK